MSSKQFSQEQKLAIVENAATIGFKKAAEIAGVHYTTVYDWRRNLKSLGKEAFLAYQPSYPGRGIKVISAEKEAAVLDCWKTNPGFGPGQVGGQVRRQGMTATIRCRTSGGTLVLPPEGRLISSPDCKQHLPQKSRAN